MKTIVKYISLIIISLFTLNLNGQNTEQKMKEAADLYQKGDYYNAATIYKQLYDQGYRSGNLLYNAGNAWYKAKDYGYAVLFYERAKLLSPASEDINYNLQMAKSHVTDKFEGKSEVFFARWFDFLALLNSTNNWAVIALVLFILTLALGLSFLFLPLQRFRAPSFWSAIVTLCFSVLSIIFSVKSNHLVNHNDDGIVVCNEVVGKSSPGDEGKELFVIHSGVKVRIIQRLNDFSEIKLPDGNKGWASNNCIERI